MAYVFQTGVAPEQLRSQLAGVPFYHSFSLSNCVHVDGDYNIEATLSQYAFPQDMTGWRVLDIGPASGWFSFYFEALGADVTVVETRGYRDFDRFGDRNYAPPNRPPDRIQEGRPIWFGPVSKSFWLMHDTLKSKVRWVNARIYDVTPELFGGATFDFVFIGQLLLHLRDPIGALKAARSVCHGTCFTTTYDWLEHEESVMPMQAMPWTALDTISWFLPNKAAYALWLKGAGFTDVDVERRLEIKAGREARDERGRVVNVPSPARIGIGRVR